MKYTFFTIFLLLWGIGVIASEQKAPENKDRTPSKEELMNSVTVEVKPTEPRTEFKKGKQIPHLILTSDAKIPTRMAEIVRRENGTVYLQIPLDEKNGGIMVRPAKTEDAFQVKKEQLARFIAFLNPKQVIFLGGFENVPAEYRVAVPVGCAAVDVSDTNWNVNAITLGNYLKFQKLNELFRAECSAISDTKQRKEK